MRTRSLLAAAAVLATAPAHADPNRDELSLGATARALRSSSANALTGANLAGGSLGVARDVGHDLGVALPAALSLWLEAGFATGSATGEMFQSLATSIETLDLTAGLAARYRLHRLLGASLRLATGAQRVRVALDDHAGAPAYDHAWGARASAAVSLDLFALSRPPLGLGVRLEAGYVAAQHLALTPHTDAPSDALTLAMTSAALGHLDLSGPSATVSLLGQF